MTFHRLNQFARLLSTFILLMLGQIFSHGFAQDKLMPNRASLDLIGFGQRFILLFEGRSYNRSYSGALDLEYGRLISDKLELTGNIELSTFGTARTTYYKLSSGELTYGYTTYTKTIQRRLGIGIRYYPLKSSQTVPCKFWIEGNPGITWGIQVEELDLTAYPGRGTQLKPRFDPVFRLGWTFSASRGIRISPDLSLFPWPSIERRPIFRRCTVRLNLGLQF